MRLFLLFIALYPFAATAILRVKFKHFFPHYERYLLEAASECGLELSNYWRNNNTSCRGSHAPCSCAADCLLRDLPGTMQSNMASGAVLLGLVPPILVFIGPSLADVAILSLYDPILVVLLALASPAVNLSRLIQREDLAMEIQKPVSVTFRRSYVWLDHHPVYKPVLVSLKWILAIAALANNVSNSVQLDLRTISGWRCSARMLPLVWSIFALVVHSFAIVAVRLRRYETGKKDGLGFRSGSWELLPGSHDTLISECLMWAGSVCAVVHMVFGILDLSSLSFISADDAVLVAVRYMVNALVCQVILLVEVACMRSRLKPNAT